MSQAPDHIIIKVIRCLDGLSFAFAQLEHSYEMLYDDCAQLKGDKSRFTSALSHAWAFIDDLHRIREISQSLPTLSKRCEELQVFLTETKATEEMRNYVQHLRQELNKTPPDPFPVWGCLSWVDPSDPTLVHTAIAGSQLPGTSFGSCIYDKRESKWMSRVTLTLGQPFHFDLAIGAARSYHDFIMPWILGRQKINELEELPIVSARFPIADDLGK